MNTSKSKCTGSLTNLETNVAYEIRTGRKYTVSGIVLGNFIVARTSDIIEADEVSERVSVKGREPP